eukprot:UN23783
MLKMLTEEAFSKNRYSSAEKISERGFRNLVYKFIQCVI